MPVISEIERRTWRSRAILTFIYAILGLGALSMIYPFVVMLGTSITSMADYQLYNVVPSYIYDDRMLLAKYIEDKYNGSITEFNDYHFSKLSHWHHIARE